MSPHRSSAPPRPGVILVVVVIMLTLFLVVGLSFVLYAESEATASRIYREVPQDTADIQPDALLAWALGQIIYPVPDDETGVYSAVRGHELARTMWGWNYNTVNGTSQVDPNTTNAVTLNAALANSIPYSQANTTPFNGMGPLRFPPTSNNGSPTVPVPAMFAGTGLSDYNLVNYTWYSGERFLRDPERLTFRQDNGSAPFAVNKPILPFAGGFNAPYTYPDRTNMVLAAVQASAGGGPRLWKPSFFVPIPVAGLGNMNNLLFTEAGANATAFWTANNATYKYLTLRPRPADQLLAGETLSQGADGVWRATSATGAVRLAFPPPADAGGDVKNLPGVSLPYIVKQGSGPPIRRDAVNDSFWMDLGYPVQVTRNGKKFKPMFAFLVMDLDGKVNLNVHGNTVIASQPVGNTYVGAQTNVAVPASDPRFDPLGTMTRDHGSNQGLGRYEVNLSKVLTAPVTDANGNVVLNPYTSTAAQPKLFLEWPKLFTGVLDPAVPLTNSVLPLGSVGRYGNEMVTLSSNMGVPVHPSNVGKTVPMPEPSTRATLAGYDKAYALGTNVYLDAYNLMYNAKPGVRPSSSPFLQSPPFPPNTPDPGYPGWLAAQHRSLLHPFDLDTGTGLSLSRLATPRFNMPLVDRTATNNALLYEAFPSFSAAQPGIFDKCDCTFDPNTMGPDPNTAVATNDPLSNHPLLNQVLSRSATDTVFGDENMFHVLAGDFTKSTLYGLIPNNISLARVRQLVTTRSFDLDAPGAQPWVTSSTDANYILPDGAPYPVGGPRPDGTVGTIATPPPAQIANFVPPPNDYSDFKPGDGRASLLSRVDLARKLTPFRDPSTGKFGYIDPGTNQFQYNPPTTYPDTTPPSGFPGTGMPILDPLGRVADLAMLYRHPLAAFPQLRYYYALADRQQFAKDVFDRFVRATGARSPDEVTYVFTGAPGNPWTKQVTKTGTLHQALGANNTHHAATRYLAQLAVNIVDFIDDDDSSTPFRWNPELEAALASPDPNYPDTGWVYGVEVPKLVINEAYCELRNDPADVSSTSAALRGATNAYNFCFWLELYNPSPAAERGLPQTDRQDPDKPGNGGLHDRLAEPLMRNNYPVYQIAILDETHTPVLSQYLSQRPQNTDGWFSDGIQSSPASPLKIQVTSWQGVPNPPAPNDPHAQYFDATYVEPTTGEHNPQGSGLPKNQGFYVIGPETTRNIYDATNPLVPTLNLTTHGDTPKQPGVPYGQPAGGSARNAMWYKAPASETGSLGDPKTIAGLEPGKTRHTVMLRRLACPGLDPNPLVHDTQDPRYGQPLDPNKPFNPYVTVDYMGGVPTNDAVQYLGAGLAAPGKYDRKAQGTMPPPNQRRSWSRRQPYAATLAELSPQGWSGPGNPVNATFFKHNDFNASAMTTPYLDVPYDWLVHLDRAPATVTEIMHAAAVPPHLLTQRFITGQSDTGKPYNLDSEVRRRQQEESTNGQPPKYLVNEARHQHLAPWSDQTARLYRALEFFTVGERSPYPGTGGRVPGKVNINTTFDRDVPDAVVDAREKPNLDQNAGPIVQKTANYFYENPPAPFASTANYPGIGASTDVWNASGNPPATPSYPTVPLTVDDPANVSLFRRKQQILNGLVSTVPPDVPFTSLAAPVVPPTDAQYPTGAGLSATILPFPDADNDTVNIDGRPILVTNKGMVGTFTPRTAVRATDFGGEPPTRYRKPMTPRLVSPLAWPTPSVPAVDYNPTPTEQHRYTYVQAPISPFPPVPTQPNNQPPLQAYQTQLIPPYIMNEMLNKVSGHVTTRSNTFAVFLTVGFFEVVDDTTRPAKLGAELVTSGGKNIRHQMFSVVDRTNLAIEAGLALNPLPPDPNRPDNPNWPNYVYNPSWLSSRLRQAAKPPVFMSVADPIPVGAGGPTSTNPKATPIVINITGGLPTSYESITPVTFMPPPLADERNSQGDPTRICSPAPPAPANQLGTYWWPSRCQWMFLDIGAKQEPVQVRLDPTGTQLQLLFPNGAQYSHAPGAMLCTYQPGDPGPQGAIDYTSPQYKAVVPFAYIVQ